MNALTPIAHFWQGEALRSRSVSHRVLSGHLEVPAPPARLVADWGRETSSRLALEAGDVEPLSLARARMRWPDYRQCVQAVADWAGTLGLPGVLADSEVALMACRGARYHHDAEQYAGAAFCNLFLSEDCGLDVHFPAAGCRIPLTRGTVLLFDTGQPHAVIPRNRQGFDAADFGPDRDCTQLFLTWELPIDAAPVAQTLGIRFDVAAATAASNATAIEQQELRLAGAPVRVCPSSGRWLRADPTTAAEST